MKSKLEPRWLVCVHFSALLFASAVQLAAQSTLSETQNSHPKLSIIVEAALERDVELARLALAADLRLRQNELDQRSEHSPVSLSLGEAGLQLQGSESRTQVQGAPSADFRLGQDGDTRIGVASPFSFRLDGNKTSSLAPRLSLSHTFRDVAAVQTADPDAIEDEIAKLSQAADVRARRAAVVEDVLSAVGTVFTEERGRIAAELDLRDAQTRRDQQVRVLRQNPGSSTVLAIDDEIASAEFNLNSAKRKQLLAVRLLQHSTGFETLSVAGILALEKLDPQSIAVEIPPDGSRAYSILTAEFQLRLQTELVRELGQSNPLSLTLSTGAGVQLSTDAAGSLSQYLSAEAGVLLSEGTNWSLGLGAGYTGAQSGDELSLSLSGTFSPGPTSAASAQAQDRRAMQDIRVQQARLSLANAQNAIRLSLEDYEIRLEQLELTEATWRRRLAIAQAALAEAQRTLTAGLGTADATQSAALNLASLEMQGISIALDRVLLNETIQRNFYEE